MGESISKIESMTKDNFNKSCNVLHQHSMIILTAVDRSIVESPFRFEILICFSSIDVANNESLQT